MVKLVYTYASEAYPVRGGGSSPLRPTGNNFIWKSSLAYAVGLIATDGSLSKDGRHLDFTSKDLEQINNFRKIFKLPNKIGTKGSGFSKNVYYRIQFGNKNLYSFLNSIGLCYGKTKILKSLLIPDLFFPDFLRGSFDGDGYSYSYRDKVWTSSYRLYIGFTSASKNHLSWIKKTIQRLYEINGAITFAGKSTYILKYAKYASISLIKIMYWSDSVICLERKKSKIEQTMRIIDKQAGIT